MPERKRTGNQTMSPGCIPELRMGDRRDSHRVPTIIEVRQENDDYERYTGDLSIGGVYFEKQIGLPPGAIVLLHISLVDMVPWISAKGEVISDTSGPISNYVGTRLRFVDLDISTELLIAKFIDTRSTRL